MTESKIFINKITWELKTQIWIMEMKNYREATTADKIQVITENEAYKEILKDSFGGVMYNIANQNKYDTVKLLKLWEALTPSKKESTGGIMSGAINFIQWKN